MRGLVAAVLLSAVLGGSLATAVPAYAYGPNQQHDSRYYHHHHNRCYWRGHTHVCSRR